MALLPKDLDGLEPIPTHHSPRRSLLWRVLFCCATFLAVVSGGREGAAQSAGTLECSVVTGLGGLWKIGFSTPHRLELRGDQNLRGRIEIQTVDGDGVPVKYQNEAWLLDLSNQGRQSIELIAKHGRGDRPIRILIRDATDQVLIDRLLTESERGTALPATQPWVVGIGAELGLQQAAMKSVQGAFGEYSVSDLTTPASLALQALAYEGVDVILLSSRNSQINSEISDAQGRALEGWVRTGGQMVLTWGEHAMQLADNRNLTSMIPGELVGIANECEPSPIESLLGSQQQLRPMTCALLRLRTGRVDVGTLTSTRVKLPFIARWAYGFGNVVWMATEIDSPELRAWETRPAVIKYLLKDAWEKGDGKPLKGTFQAYEELAGQLNASLNTFANLRLSNLGQLVLIAAILALVIGPVDYFLVSKFWKRPRWTWWTLLVASFVAMMVTASLARSWKPDLPSLNSLELIDVDDQTQTLHGRGFAQCYAGRRGVYDFLAHHRSLSLRRDEVIKPRPNRIEWFGQPGKGLGGFDSNVSTQLGLPSYANHASTELDSELVGVGFPAAGTKGLFTQWHESVDMPDGSNALTTVSGKDDLLQGSFSNPLGVDLLDATLYFAGRAYTIPARIRPGERIPITTSIPKDITRRLQRRTFVAGEEQGVEWDPNSTKNIDRLAELLTFHRSAGGAAYTGLFNRYLAVLECSDLLKLERAVVVARIADPVTGWTLRRNQIPVQTMGGNHQAFVRLVLQVAINNPSTSPAREYPIPTPQ